MTSEREYLEGRGWQPRGDHWLAPGEWAGHIPIEYQEHILERLALAIQRAIDAAVAAEREECAKVAEGFPSRPSDAQDYAENIAAAIRARAEE